MSARRAHSRRRGGNATALPGDLFLVLAATGFIASAILHLANFTPLARLADDRLI